jgi:molybdopterin molybdotransferase
LGLQALPVRRRVRVAIFSTGDEIVEPGAASGGRALRREPRSAARLLRRLGAEVSDLGILRDDPAKLAARLAEAASGTTSCSPRAASRPAKPITCAPRSSDRQLVFWRVAIKPGGRSRWACCAARRSSVCRQSGRGVRHVRARGAAAAAAPCGRDAEPLIALPVASGFCLSQEEGPARICAGVADAARRRRYEAHKHPQDGAGVISSLTATDGLAELDDDVTEIAAGQAIGFPALLGAWPDRAVSASAIIVAISASSGVLTLKNGSTGSTASRRARRRGAAVHTSILRKSSTVMA